MMSDLEPEYVLVRGKRMRLSCIQNMKLRRVAAERLSCEKFRFFGGGGYKEYKDGKSHNDSYRESTSHTDYMGSYETGSHHDHRDHTDKGYSETVRG